MFLETLLLVREGRRGAVGGLIDGDLLLAVERSTGLKVRGLKATPRPAPRREWEA